MITDRPKLTATAKIALYGMFSFHFTVRRRFMPCDRRGVSYTIVILVFTLHYMFSDVFK